MAQPAHAETATPRIAVARLGTYFRKRILRNWDLYLIVSVPVAYIIIFHYVPMYGAQIAFRNFSPIKGIWGSPWVGLEHVVRFAESFGFGRIFGNTLGLSVYASWKGWVETATSSSTSRRWTPSARRPSRASR